MHPFEAGHGASPGFSFHSGGLPGLAGASSRQPRPALIHRKQSGFSAPTTISPVYQTSSTSSPKSSFPLPASPVLQGQHGAGGGRSALSHLMLQLSTPPMRMPLASPAPGDVPLSHIMQPHPPSPSDFFNFSTAAGAEKGTGHGADAPADYFSSRSCTRAADARARSASDVVSEARMGLVSSMSTSSFAPSSVDSLTFTDSTSSPPPSACSSPNAVSPSSAPHPLACGKAAVPAANLSDAREEAMQRQFLNREELLSLSPYQTSILQEAHAEARRRAMEMERAEEEEQGHGDGDGDGDRTMTDVKLEDLLGDTSTRACRLAVSTASTSPVDSAFNAMLLTSPQTEDREHFDEMAAAAEAAVTSSDTSISASATSPLLSGRPAITCPAPQADFYKATSGSASQRAKQLGTFPADEAFATSLEQLTAGRIDRNAKPTCLWWSLIRAAILGSPERRLQMETLCATISEHFPWVALSRTSCYHRYLLRELMHPAYADRYFGRAKEAKNWKSSIRSVIHTKPCFYKTEDAAIGAVWWHVDVAIDPREQRRGLKKRSSVSSGGDEAEGSSEARKRVRTAVQEAMSGIGAALRGEMEEAEASASEVESRRERRTALRAHDSSRQRKRRRKTQ